MYFKLIYKTDENDILDCIVKFDNKYHKNRLPSSANLKTPRGLKIWALTLAKSS